MQHWLLVRGRGDRPLERFHGDRVEAHSSSRRPSHAPGDLVVLYASVWQAVYGVAQVAGPAEHDASRTRWSWRFPLRPLLLLEDLDRAPAVEEVGVFPSSPLPHPADAGAVRAGARGDSIARRMRIGVVGLGAMGSGIAQLAIEAGLDTVGRDVELARAESARDRIAHFLTRKVEKGQLERDARDAAVERLRLTTDPGDLADCDVVIEAAFEDLGVKHQLFRELERVVRDDAVLATNTSALSVTEIASVLERPERAVGMHFFNPAPLMPLVEIVRAERTADGAFETAFELARKLGKTPIRCSDTPGFVVNRVLIPLLNDCVRVLDETGVTPEDLDAGMRLGAGWPMGPLALLDLVGADVHVHASEALYEKLREPRMAPPPRLVRMLQAGKLGRKTGEGFYTY